jgi:DNA-binding transcriptional MerR regulator/methylmalonyl-CoA mutase cobalamin-binding subunit
MTERARSRKPSTSATVAAAAEQEATAAASRALAAVAADTETHGQDRGLLRIRSVARATGLSPDTLRVWERRYGSLASRRSAAGYRLYSESDVRRLTLLRALIGAGHAIGEIAMLAPTELERLAARLAGQPMPGPEGLGAQTRARFLESISGLDTTAAERAIAACRLVLPPLELVREVIVPLLHDVGERWVRDEFSIAQEHAASAVVRGHLGDVLRTLEAPIGAPVAISATPAGEMHEFGALIAGIIAGTQAFRVVYLGANVPAEDFARAAKDGGARVALLSCVAIPKDACAREVRAIRRALPPAIALVAGGPALPAPLPAGVTSIGSLDALASTLAALRG